MASHAGGWYSSSGRDYGRLGFYAIASGKHTLQEVENAVEAVIDELVKNGVTKDELNRAKNAYIADYVYGVDSQSQMARRFGWALVVGQNVADVEEWPTRLEQVSVDDISRVAKKYLLEKRSVTGLLIPTKADKQTVKAGADKKAGPEGKG
jgi:zinc protease